MSTASAAVHTIGSPWRLNEVLSTAPTPVRRSNSRMTAWYSGFHVASRICGRAVRVLGMERRRQGVARLRLRRHGQHHVGRGEALGIHEVVVGPLGQHRRRERHPEVAVLDHPVDQPAPPGGRRDWRGWSGCRARARRTPSAPRSGPPPRRRRGARRCAPRCGRGRRPCTGRRGARSRITASASSSVTRGAEIRGAERLPARRRPPRRAHSCT